MIMGRNFPTDSSFTPSPTEVADTDYFPVAVTGDVVKRVPMSTVRASAIGAPDGSTPGSVLARLDTNEDDIASLGAAVGPLPVAIDALEAIVGTVRTVTGNATLDGTEGVVIIDAAGSVEITLDAGAAARRVRVLRIGDASLYATVFARDGGTGTINGAASSYTVYGTTTAGISIDLWATAAHEWHTSTTVYETLVELVGTTIPALTARVAALEAPTPAVEEGSTSVSWTTQARLYIGEDSALVTVSLDATEEEWPVGQERIASVYNTGGHGFELVVPTGHKLNLVTDGESGALGAEALAQDAPLPSVLVSRLATDEWTWG